MAPMRSLLAGAIAALIGLTACGPAASSPGSPLAASPNTQPSSSAAGSTPVTSPATPRPSSSQALVIPHDDPALEALLPNEVDGTQLLKFSVGPGSSAPGQQGLADVARRIGDGSGSFGLAYAGDPDGGFNLFLLRVPGADSSELLTQFAQMTYAGIVGGSFESTSLGGRDVVHIVDPASEIGDIWFYARDDLLLGVQAGTATQATELLALLGD